MYIEVYSDELFNFIIISLFFFTDTSIPISKENRITENICDVSDNNDSITLIAVSTSKGKFRLFTSIHSFQSKLN